MLMIVKHINQTVELVNFLTT